MTTSGIFVVAYLRGVAVGCSGFRRYETQAISWGAARIILESRVRNTAALTLLATVGYEPIARYVPGRDPATSRAFTPPSRTG
jgi:hypothetical protein